MPFRSVPFRVIMVTVYIRRPPSEESRILCNFRDYGPDEEDFEMFGLALKRLKEDKDELVDGVPWAYYPSDILYCVYTQYI